MLRKKSWKELSYRRKCGTTKIWVGEISDLSKKPRHNAVWDSINVTAPIFAVKPVTFLTSNTLEGGATEVGFCTSFTIWYRGRKDMHSQRKSNKSVAIHLRLVSLFLQATQRSMESRISNCTSRGSHIDVRIGKSRDNNAIIKATVNPSLDMVCHRLVICSRLIVGSCPSWRRLLRVSELTMRWPTCRPELSDSGQKTLYR